ncbi:MAG: hypothetical protein U0263_24995 [Polyangiaceae bacterium]
MGPKWSDVGGNMGLFSTHWAGEYQGHKIEVVRKVGGHEFDLLIDGEMADRQTSLANMGKRELEGSLHVAGRDLTVHAVGIQNAFSEAAEVTVDGQPVTMTKIK